MTDSTLLCFVLVNDSTSSDDGCDPSVSSSCESDEVCLATGITGRNTCVDRESDI